jgi:hypothetical protein
VRRSRQAAIDTLVARVHPEPEAEPVDLDARIAAALAEREATASAERAHRQAEALFTSPCRFCGYAMVEERGRGTEGECSSCSWHLTSRRFDGPDGQRDYAAFWLLYGTQGSRMGLGAELGLQWWYELPTDARPTRATTAFSWISDTTLAAWRASQEPPAREAPPPPAPKLHGSTRPRSPRPSKEIVTVLADPVKVAAGNRRGW